MKCSNRGSEIFGSSALRCIEFISDQPIRLSLATTEAGRAALGYYYERQDEKRSIGLGPEHDWSSHAASAFGYMANRLRGAAF
jgi:phage terminase large subunit